MKAEKPILVVHRDTEEDGLHMEGIDIGGDEELHICLYLLTKVLNRISEKEYEDLRQLLMNQITEHKRIVESSEGEVNG